MAWLRIDDGFAQHPKIAALTDRELRIWLRVLCYCGRQGDPTIDALVVKEVPGLTPRFVSKLVSLCLLDRYQDSHEIHDWIAYQPKDKTGADRQARFRARRRKQAENEETTDGRGRYDSNDDRNGAERDETVTSRAGTPAFPSRPLKEQPLLPSTSVAGQGGREGLNLNSDILKDIG